MTSTSWMKGLLMAVVGFGGLATTAGAALAAPPDGRGDRVAEVGDVGGFGFGDAKGGRFDGRFDGREDRFDGRGDGRFDGPRWKVARIARDKIADGRALQERGQRLLLEARIRHSRHLGMRARFLIAQGERTERLGWAMLRDARDARH